MGAYSNEPAGSGAVGQPIPVISGMGASRNESSGESIFEDIHHTHIGGSMYMTLTRFKGKYHTLTHFTGNYKEKKLVMNAHPHTVMTDFPDRVTTVRNSSLRVILLEMSRLAYTILGRKETLLRPNLNHDL